MKDVIRTLACTLVILLFIGLFGCTSETGDYPIAIVWADNLYGLSVKEVSSDELEEQIGEVRRVKRPMPVKSGDANFIPVGSKVFEIKGIDIEDAIAVEKDGARYKAIRLQEMNNINEL